MGEVRAGVRESLWARHCSAVRARDNLAAEEERLLCVASDACEEQEVGRDREQEDDGRHGIQ